MRPLLATALLIAAAPVTSATAAQSGLGSLIGGGLPNVASVGAGNAAGLLGYCVKNRISNSVNANAVLGKLTGQPNVATSSGYAAGQNGLLQTGKTSFSLDTLKGQAKTRVCDLVLKKAQSFL